MPPRTATSILTTLLSNPTSLPHLSTLVSETCTYTSLCLRNPSLRKLMPYCGIHSHSGPAAIASTFTTVSQIWENEDFTVETLFSDEGTPDQLARATSGDGNVQVAMFGHFTYLSTVLRKRYTSPFAIWCTIDMNHGDTEDKPEQRGRVVKMLFMEDTFGTGATFEKSGEKVYEVEAGKEIRVGIVGSDVGEGDSVEG